MLFFFFLNTDIDEFTTEPNLRNRTKPYASSSEKPIDQVENALIKAKETFKTANVVVCREAHNPDNIVFIGYDNDCKMNILHESEVDGIKIIIKHPFKIDDQTSPSSVSRMRQGVTGLGLSLEEEQRITACIEEHGQDLWQKHSNLTIISGDVIKMCGGEERKQVCIVLYCLSKGYIPIEEEAFPRKLGSLEVDVREGYFLLGTNTRRGGLNYWNDPLCMGSNIGHENRQSAGTLGLFVNIPGTLKPEVGFITCCHVLLDCIGKGTYHFTKDESNPVRVKQPSTITFCGIKDRVCGEIERAVFAPQFNQCSVDAALVRVTSRPPTSGHFVIRDKLQVLDAGKCWSYILTN